MAVGWSSLFCYLLVFSLYWITWPLIGCIECMPLCSLFAFALLGLEYSFCCCLWAMMFLWGDLLKVIGHTLRFSECMLLYHSTLPYLFFSTPSVVACDLPYCCGLYFKKFWCRDLLKVGGHTLCSILVLSFFLCYLSISLLLFCSGCKDIRDFQFCCIFIVHRRMFMCFEARLNPVVLLWSLLLVPQLFLST